MVTRFGSREITDVTFKAIVDNQKIGTETFKKGQPVFFIDTATASSMEQATTTVYAQGGRGYARLIAWEGEKTMTFTVTDALMSPLGLAMLTGAGIGDASNTEFKHVHFTVDATVDSSGVGTIPYATLADELTLTAGEDINICVDAVAKPYATIIDGNGALIGWVKELAIKSPAKTNGQVTVKTGGELKFEATGAKSTTVKLDLYAVMKSGVTQITIAPEDFGGSFYVEADTLYRNQSGQDMAATITFPNVKIQSGFTLSMAPTGDPSTFDFTMDAFPAYTVFDGTKKVICDINIVGGTTSKEEAKTHIDKHFATEG